MHDVQVRRVALDWWGHPEVVVEAECVCGWFVSEPTVEACEVAAGEHLTA